jgi:hypothetical protein
MNQPARGPVGPLWACASKKMNVTAAVLAPQPTRTGITNTGKPLLVAVLFGKLRKRPIQTIQKSSPLSIPLSGIASSLQSLPHTHGRDPV